MSKETLYFLDMFSEYAPEAFYAEKLAKAQILSADINAGAAGVDVVLFLPEYIPQEDLNRIAGEVAAIYGLRGGLLITAKFPADQISQISEAELMALFVGQNSINLATLAGAKWEWEDNNLSVFLRANGKDTLMECLPFVKRYLKERFDTDVNVNIVAGEVLEGSALQDKMKKIREDIFENLPKVSYSAPNGQTKEESKKTIYGKPIRTAPIPMKEVELNMGSIAVEGKVFAISHKDLPKNGACVIHMDITDYTSSVHISRYLKNAEAKPIVESIKMGDVIKVQGKMEVDSYTNEVYLKPFAIEPGSMPQRTDTEPGEKRVELHLHTSMSNMDALTNTDTAIRQAAKWGHRAIAITDHGCCQSFTDALHTVEDRKKKPLVAGTEDVIKILYGCEGYYINDVDDRTVVHGDKDIPLDGEYVAFDLETTGLYPQRDKIIEFGAVRMKDGQEIDRFEAFVNPGQRLEKRTTDLTGITDEMLKDAPTIDEVLPKFIAFVGDSVLVAHNADFDTSFIYHACKEQGVPYRFTSVDTLTLAQNLLTKLSRFSLDVVAKHFNLDDFNHHRAGDDALTCGKIMAAFIPLLQEMGIHSIQQINDAMVPLRIAHRQNGVHCQHIVLFAKNQLGLRNLYRLISEANLHYFKKFPRIFKSELMKYREGLIVGSACENNEVFQAVVSGKPEEELKRLADFYDYLEIQPVSNNRFMLIPKKEDEEPIAQSEEELREFNRRIVWLGEETGKPVVATGDVHFLNPEDEIFRHILLATKKFADCDRENPLYLRTTDEMLEEFSYLGQEKAREVVVTNSNYIADMCETIRPVPYNLFAPTIENSAEELKNLVYEKMHRLYGDNPPELIRKRVETELGDIINCHYDVIYISAQRLVKNSLENGYLVGSRGSVGSSIVAFLSGITEVNSFPPHYRCPNPQCKHTTFDVPTGYACGADLPDEVCPECGTPYEKEGFNIPFETFLGFGGDKVPDIDLNFSGEYQAEAHAYCTQMFGKSYVFRAGTVGKVADKTAFGFVKKYLEERGTVASNAEIARLANGCVGVRRTTGQHPGGLVVIPKENEIWDFCPVQHPADDPNSDQITTHFEYHSMEDNLLKLDMLGHDDPTMIKMMEDVTGVDAKKIPLDDKRTMSIFTSSKVLGYEDDKVLGPTGAVAIPEFNTRFTRGMLLDTMPTRFDTLVRLSGFSHGEDVWLGNAKELIKSGKATVDGTIGCRDDIMMYLISCGIEEKRAFKIMEAVRKGRGLPEGAEQEMKDAGVPDWYIGSCKKIKYLFPKAHAVAYVMMAFRIAWFKVNYPLAFYAAYFYRRSQKGGFNLAMMTGGLEKARANIEAIDANEESTNKDEDFLTTLEVVYEFYLRGFEFLPVDIYKSSATHFVIEDGKIRPPFVAISGLGESAAFDIVEGRKGKDFISVEEFSAACPKVSKTHLQALREAGAFGDLPDTSQVSLF